MTEGHMQSELGLFGAHSLMTHHHSRRLSFHASYQASCSAFATLLFALGVSASQPVGRSQAHLSQYRGPYVG